MAQTQTATAFDGLRRAYEAAYNAEDTAALGELFTEDAKLMPPNGPVVEGRAGVVAFYQAWFDQFTTNISIGTDETLGLGDLAVGRGTFTAKLTPKAGGDTMTLEGKYMNLSQPQADGSLKLCRHIWNLPMPEPGS